MINNVFLYIVHIKLTSRVEFSLSHKNCSHSSAAFRDLVKLSNSFKPSSGDFASANSFTMALPTITPSAPHPATCNRSYGKVPCAWMAGGITFYIQAFKVEVGKETCFTCSGVDMPKPTATGLVETCHIINPRLLVKGPFNSR